MALFKAGQSGNPSGRPRGIVSQAKLRASIEKDLPGIIEAMVQQAQAGGSALDVVLRRKARNRID